MTNQDKLSVLITFIFGLVVGGYLYLTGFATTFKLPEAGQEATYAGLIITADSYGACERENACLSYQILEDGSYRAVFDTTGVKLVVEDSVTRLLKRDLIAALVEAELKIQTKEKTTPGCHYGADSTNYRFNITLNGRDYLLDTCSSAIDYDGIVWNTLLRTWTEVASK
jgi:hypothetical protein